MVFEESGKGISKISRMFQGCFRVFQGCFRVFQGYSNEVSTVLQSGFQGSSKGVSSNVQGCSKKASRRVFQRRLKDVMRMLGVLRSFMGISNVFLSCINSVSSMFQ